MNTLKLIFQALCMFIGVAVVLVFILTTVRTCSTDQATCDDLLEDMMWADSFN